MASEMAVIWRMVSALTAGRSDGECRQSAASHEQLFADLDDLDELGGIGIEVDHVAGLARGLSAGIHGNAYVSLGEGGRIVGAVAAHRDQLALGLLVADELELVLRRCLGEEIVHARFRRNRRSRHRIVARDHDGADTHATQLSKPFTDAALDDILEVNDAASTGRHWTGTRDLPRLRRSHAWDHYRGQQDYLLLNALLDEAETLHKQSGLFHDHEAEIRELLHGRSITLPVTKLSSDQRIARSRRSPEYDCGIVRPPTGESMPTDSLISTN
jgi:hypothetical protein